MKLITLTGVVVALLLVAPTAQQPPDLAGVYVCEGQNGDGAAYTAVVEIIKHGEVWGLSWAFEGGTTGTGVGIVQQGVLAAIFHLSATGEIGLVAYAIEPTAPLTLVGRWMLPGVPATSTETLTKTAVRNPALLRGPRRGA